MDGAYGLELYKNVFSMLFEMNFIHTFGIFSFFLDLQLVALLECSMSSIFDPLTCILFYDYGNNI